MGRKFNNKTNKIKELIWGFALGTIHHHRLNVDEQVPKPSIYGRIKSTHMQWMAWHWTACIVNKNKSRPFTVDKQPSEQNSTPHKWCASVKLNTIMLFYDCLLFLNIWNGEQQGKKRWNTIMDLGNVCVGKLILWLSPEITIKLNKICLLCSKRVREEIYGVYGIGTLFRWYCFRCLTHSEIVQCFLAYNWNTPIQRNHEHFGLSLKIGCSIRIEPDSSSINVIK